MTERRRSLESDDAQESLFGGEAFAAAPRTPAPWQRRDATVPETVESRARARRSAAGAATDAGRPALEVRAPVDEAQAAMEPIAGPSAEDMAAYGFQASVGATVPTEIPAHDAREELAALEQATVGVPDEVRRTRAPVAGPTLDDVMSRAWEGLVTGLPASCPVCHGDVVPSFAGSLHGSCASCGTTID